MSPSAPTTDYKKDLILRGLSTIKSLPSAADRIGLMEAAADMLEDDQAKQSCRVTARILREAEDAQLRLFTLLEIPPTH